MTKEELKQENEKKKEYLRSYMQLVRRVKLLEEEIKELRTSKMFPSVVNDGMPHGSSNGDLSAYMAAKDELEQSIITARYRCIKKKTEILKKIEQLEDETERDLLTLKYLRGMNWTQIGIKLSYGQAQVHRIHGRALKHFSIDDRK